MELFSRRCNVSPLILALVFITFFHNVLSRHRIRHYKDRFKRQQGEHLYLPGSYVTEGGSGSDLGPWSDWSEPSPCSRTCGGGVSTQSRTCSTGYTCQGPEKRHFTCNTQDCPDISDYRAQQCADFDKIPFEGVYYQWVPYTKAPNSCELNCMPRGERFYFRHAPTVIDGTRCNDEKLDVCVNGMCQPVGCDMMLGSNAREDQCRVCGGNGSTCNTIENVFPMRDMQVGYNDILLIPAGATNIRVEEMGPSNNYLAVRNTSGHYYLNGNWRIDFPRTIEFSGTKFHYDRNPQGFSAPDIISCLGPTDEPLFIVVLYQDSDVPVRYTYSVPTNVVPGSESETYAWIFDEFTPCSATCGGGLQYRNVTCAGRKTLEPVDRSLCNADNEPESQKRCNEVPCQAQWVPQPWKDCSSPCGEGGTQTREISCQQVLGSGYPALADEAECLKHHPKPPNEQKCNVGKICAKWHTGPWKPCDHLCGDGKQARNVTCFIKKDGKIEVLKDDECEAIEPKPEEEKNCNVRPCEGVDWITSEWSGCERVCGLTNETRRVHCATAGGKIYPDDLCEPAQKPETVKKCETTNATCEYLWYASQWSECSVRCGQGVQTRTLFCGVITPEGVKKVETSKCDPSKHFETIKNCTGEEEECEGEWFSGPWGKCSKPCGGGERTKKVVCLKDEVVVNPSLCGSDKIVFSQEECNTHPCSEDTIMPTDVTQSLDESETLKDTPSEEATTWSTKETEETEQSDFTDGFEITSEASRVTLPPSEDDEYEIVEATQCDDGEWVEMEDESADLKAAEDQDKPVAGTSDIPVAPGQEKEKTTTGTTEAPFSIDDLMLSDGPYSTDEEEATLEGSGAETATESGVTKATDITDEEGSGTEPITTDTVVSLITSEKTDFSQATTESGVSDGSTDVSGVTTEASGATTEVSETVSDVSDLTTESDGTTESSASATTAESAETDVTTESSGSDSTADTPSSDLVTESGSTSDVTESLGSDLTTDVTSSGSSESSASTDFSAGTDTVISLDTTVSTDVTEDTDTTGSTDTTDSSATTESTDTTESSATTESSDTTENSATTESTDTTESSATTESTDTTESSATTESTDASGSTDTTGSTETTEGTDVTESTEESEVTPTAITTESASSEYSTETSVEPSGSEDTTITGTGVSDETTTELFIGESNVGEKRITESRAPGETTTEFTGSTEETTEAESSTLAFTGSTEATTEFTGTTEGVTELTTEGVTTELGSTGSTTEFTGTTEGIATTTGVSTEPTTEFTGPTEATTEYTGPTEETTVSDYDIFTSTTESGPTEETTYGTTPLIDIFKKKHKMCKRRKVMACMRTPYGCCWDNITPAEGPFDKGCPVPKTCKESKFGCCEDGVSAALGPKLAGCPSSHCNETLFGCCPDNKTAAAGNDNEGCPVPLPECAKTKYGCCKDNASEAKGPEQKGCEEEKSDKGASTEKPDEGEQGKEVETETEPAVTEEPEEDCRNTTYRCCPDEVTAAEGPGYQGCGLPCSNSTFACCPDGDTPAHGPSGEGCCLSSAFGCCPDNIVPAQGPNLEGCGCQYAPYGCCPDNATYARGYDNEGCGCQYTEHGCCPDSFTPAHGPDYEGCLCHTFQFGCCADGFTVATGPHQQGCGCENTEFGCCSDNETPSSGPNMEGCGCVSSKFGCCLDGVTEAKGDNFEDCETAPMDLQASCSLPKERGTCRNYTVKWFFDMDYGGCSRFWYGGCDGNSNRFKTKAECDQVCVEPKGPDTCNLPKVAGPCEGYYPQWFYDKDQNHCAQFIYGGCLGNNNRFETREECMNLCVKDRNRDACEQPKEEGPCKGNYQRHYYDKESEKCSAFVYGGCKGNNNNFLTIEACQQKCADPLRKKDHCSLPRAQGNCTERLPRWYHDTPEKRCVPFYYSGCGGNQNNFDTKEACETDCPREIVKDTCQLPAEVGECANYVDRWYYDTKEKVCRQFYYGGCGGNGNNFETQQRCQERCQAPQPTPPSQPSQPSEPYQPSEPFQSDMCFLPADPGPCRAFQVKYYYDRADGVCKNFGYGGCEGNRNKFSSVEECLQYCGTAQDLCTLPPVVGPCNGDYPQYYYSASNDTCVPFNYGGCGGNYNRFQDQSSCEQRCKKAPSAQVTQAPTAPPSDIVMCYQPLDAGNCSDYNVAFFFDRETRKCSPFTYTGCGGNDNRFHSEEQCERQCGSFRGQDVCNMEKDPGPCRGYFLKYYYDRTNGRCDQFAFGGCQGNGNRFSSKEECEHICVTREETKPNFTSTAICKLPVDQGSCVEGYYRRWYFDDERGECLAFIYTGCGGNFNNFKTFQSCIDFCRDLLQPTPPPAPAEITEMAPPCQGLFDECTSIRCAYGVEAYVDENECNRCQCSDPCRGVGCLEDEQCAIDINRNKTSSADADFIAICRKSNKPGTCPTLEPSETNCEQECRTDADCTLHLKCCSTGCGTACVDPTPPAQMVTQEPEPAYTEGSVETGVQPPTVDSSTYEPEVEAPIGDQATLRCAVTGNPNPRISWSKDNIEIDGTQPRYRIKLDQSLQIITLHKTDSGIYLCTADNGIGDPITNQIKLDVVADGAQRPVSILDQREEPPVVVSLNAPATLNCYAMGWPYPTVAWYKDDSLIPLKNSEFEVRKDYSLLIHSVKLHNLGIYTCQAYNGIGKAASWSVTVKAKGPYRFSDPKELRYRQFIIAPPEEPATTPATTPATRPATVAATRPTLPYTLPHRPTPAPYVPPTDYVEPDNEIVPEHLPLPDAEGAVVPPAYIVPVRANITTSDQRYPVGGDIQLPCQVTGYPEPQVNWYKDGASIHTSERIQISDTHTLTIMRATKEDSGYYQCEAENTYSSASSTLEILIESMFIHPSCKDNQFFANCTLIVQGKYCVHPYYAKFCCKSCTEAGLLPADGSFSLSHKRNALSTNLV